MEILYILKYNLSLFIILTGVLGVFLCRKEKERHWYLFPFFLILLGVLDNAGAFIPHHLRNYYYTFLVIPYEVFFYLYLLYKESPGKKDLMIISIIFYLLSFAIELVINKNSNSEGFGSLSYLIANIILLIFILNYFFRLSTSEKVLTFTRQKMFWVSLGLLVFWLGSLPYYGLYNYLTKKHYDILVSYTWLIVFLNYIMYFLFICSFIWGAKRN